MKSSPQPDPAPVRARSRRFAPGGLRCGVDVGGTKIEAALIGCDGAVVSRRRVPAPRNYAELPPAVRDLIAACEEDAGATPGAASVGVGHPGSLSPATGVVRNANSTWLNGKPLDRDLKAALGRPVRLANDADCFALSEATDGAGADGEIVFGVILGTGVGGGVVIAKKLLAGAQAIAGEWGHNRLPLTAEDGPSRPCWCGRSGCVEAHLSGPAFSAAYAEASGRNAAPTDIAEAADAGEPAAAAVFDAYLKLLARALTGVINVLDPHVVVLGGGVSNIPRLAERVQERLPAHVFSDVVRTQVRANMHGDSSGVRGAAWLWPAEADAS